LWGDFRLSPGRLFNYLRSVPDTLTVELSTGVTLIRTFEPDTSAVIVPLDPLVPTIAYSVTATLSDESSVIRTYDTSLCVALSILTRTLAER
jgi:hypothetical protein